MSAKQLNYVNNGLMMFSFVLAVYLPFELFLLGYIFLGPLHYMTEIAWLKDHNFFTKGKRDWVWLTVLCGAVTVFYMLWKFRDWVAETFGPESALMGVIAEVAHLNGVLLFTGFVSAMAMMATPKLRSRIIIIGSAFAFAVVAYLTKDSWLLTYNRYLFVFAMLLPTLIHVYLFTGFFMLYGAIKSSGSSGYIGFALFAACGVGLFLINPVNLDYQASAYWLEAWKSSDFKPLNSLLLSLTAVPNSIENLVGSETGLQIQRFIAFAYVYHYLNWFSKTKIIGWHKVPRKWLIAAGTLWIVTIILYFVDFLYGFLTMFFLSMLHVFLEFPLNHHSIVGIWKGIFNVKGKAAST